MVIHQARDWRYWARRATIGPMRDSYFKRIILALDRANERRMTRPASILPGEVGRTLTSGPLTRHDGE